MRDVQFTSKSTFEALVFFYCCEVDYQHLSICIAEGLKQLGISLYSNRNYWLISPDREDYLFCYNSEVTPEDCDIVVVGSEWFFKYASLPENIFHKSRKYITVYLNSSDGALTHRPPGGGRSALQARRVERGSSQVLVDLQRRRDGGERALRTVHAIAQPAGHADGHGGRFLIDVEAVGVDEPVRVLDGTADADGVGRDGAVKAGARRPHGARHAEVALAVGHRAELRADHPRQRVPIVGWSLGTEGKRRPVVAATHRRRCLLLRPTP